MKFVDTVQAFRADVFAQVSYLGAILCADQPPDELRVGADELGDGPLSGMPIGHLRADHEYDAAGQMGDDRGIGDRHDRRRVDDRPVEMTAERRNEIGESLRAVDRAPEAGNPP